MTIASRPADHVEIAIRFIRADGPVTKNQIADELMKQCHGVTHINQDNIADNVITHGLSAGWLERYDEESFCIA